jgi:hypothetical protein
MQLQPIHLSTMLFILLSLAAAAAVSLLAAEAVQAVF